MLLKLWRPKISETILRYKRYLFTLSYCFLSTAKLGYNELGYNELLKCDDISGYNEQIYIFENKNGLKLKKNTELNMKFSK